MSTRSGRIRPSVIDTSPPRTRKGVSPPRSPARARKISPPARVGKSSPPARSPSRKSPSRKSPSRKPASKFPARKSPSRTTKETTETAAQKSPSTRPAIKSTIKVNLQDIQHKFYSGTRSRRSDYTISDLSGTKNEVPLYEALEKMNGVESQFESKDVYSLRNRKPIDEVAPRRSNRLRDEVADIRRSLSKSVSKSGSKSISQSIETISDSDSEEELLSLKKSESLTRKLATPLRESVSKLAQIGSRWEFGGRIGVVILLLLLPLTVISILISCTKSCSIHSLFNLSAFKSLSTWFSMKVFAVIAGQYIVQAIFALIPILGTKTKRMDETDRKACFNAFFSSIVTVNVIFMLNFLNILDNTSMLKDYLKLALVSYIFSLVLSFILYLKSRKLDGSDLNPYGNTGYVLYDFCVGREIHPHIKNLDIKLWISRIANISTLVLAILIFQHGFLLPANEIKDLTLESAKGFLSKVQYKPTILLYSMMQIIYMLNFIMKEHKITSTFFWQSEGVGYLQIVASALYPFYFTTISKFVADTQLSLPTNTLIIASALYFLGFFIMLVSNNIKHEFRTNPLHPRFTSLESMPTFHGKKLIVSGLWSILRHPNYTGDILIHISLALPGILTHQYMAAAPALLTILLLLHRAWRDHSRCRRRYGAAWERYCKRVPKVIIPKIL